MAWSAAQIAAWEAANSKKANPVTVAANQGQPASLRSSSASTSTATSSGSPTHVYVNPDTMVQFADGTWHKAGDLAAYFKYTTDGQGRVLLDQKTPIKLPGGAVAHAGVAAMQDPSRAAYANGQTSSGRTSGGSTGGGTGSGGGGAQQPATGALTEYEKWLQEQAELKKQGEMNSARASVDAMLNEFGLGELATQAWNQIKSGKSQEEVLQWLRGTQTYKTRFAGNELMRERLKAGKPGRVMSEKEYIAYEAEAARVMQTSGLPREFWDQQADFVKLIGNGVSVNELSSRINTGWAKVTQAPKEILRAFEQMFGAKGASNLAAYFLDPNRSEDVWAKNVAKATAKGYADILGLKDFKVGHTDRIADYTRDTDRIAGGMKEIAGMEDLFRETISENDDFTSGNEGVDAVFGGDSKDLRQRLKSRKAAFSGSGGGALLSGEGTTGFGRAD